MPFQAAASENRPELMMPYFDIVEMHTPLALWRGSMKIWEGPKHGLPGLQEGGFSGWCGVSRNCSANFSGWEWPSHVSRFPGLFHPTDSSIKAIGAFLVMNFITYVDYTMDQDFMELRAYPLLLHVSDFYESYATWDPIAHTFNVNWSCAQEQCVAQGGDGTEGNMTVSNNPPYDLGLLKRVLRRLLSWSSQLGRDAARRESWKFMLEHLAPWPLTVDGRNHTVFAQATLDGHPSGGFPTRTGPYPGPFNARYPIVYFAAIFPGEELGPDSDPSTLAIARRTVEGVNHINDWSPTNGMCMAWPPATRVLLHNASWLLNRFEYAVNLTVRPNFFPDINNHPNAGSGCPFENAGSLLAINELMLMSHNFTLRFFPAGWPSGQPSTFTNLRAKGAFLVSGTAVGGEFVGSIRIVSEAGLDCVFVAPQFVNSSRTEGAKQPCSGKLTVSNADTGESVPVGRVLGTEKLRFTTRAGGRYRVGMTGCSI